MSNGALTIYTIYARGTDGDNRFAIRAWYAKAGTVDPVPAEEVGRFDDLEMMRNALTREGKVRLGRNDTDPFNIIESWV